MKSLNCIIIFFLIHISGYQFLNAQTLSENSEISLITCNPGDELYSVFGHSAIRVKDDEKGIDWVYNYGTFNFNQPGFYVKFVRGYLNYKLEVIHMKDFLIEYQYENRSVYEQILDLNQEEKDKVFEFLEINRRPENKFYLYDFFFDNCATRIRDVFQNQLKGNIQFDESKYNGITFREMLKPNLESQPWGRFGINLVLGAIADRKSSLNESMFLPDYMKMAFGNARLAGNQNKPIVKSSFVLFEQSADNSEMIIFKRPGFIFWSFFLIVLLFTFFEVKRKIRYRLVDFSTFLFIGLIGMILFLMWIGTNHTAVVKNWNLMWAIPSHLLIAFLLFRKGKSKFLRYYFLITGIVTFSVLPFWAIIPQQFDLAFIPIILLSSVRSYQLFKYY
jgi:hypothetical protein